VSLAAGFVAVAVDRLATANTVAKLDVELETELKSE